MRLEGVLSFVLGAALTSTACADISGLSAFSTQDCPATGCSDATTHPRRDGQAPETGTEDGNTEDVLEADGGDDVSEDAEPTADAPETDGTAADGGPGDGAPPPPTDASDGGQPPRPDASIPCPDGGCPTSTATTFSACPFGSCNGSTTTACAAGGGCFCIKDSQCLSGKCVKVSGENDQSCGSSCTGTGSRDGFDCQLGSPGIPAPTGGTATYSCPPGSGFKSTTLACDSTHTNCYCNADGQCPSGKCVPSASNGNCSGCSGTGTPDFRGCQPPTVIGGCPIYIGCPLNTVCDYPICYCTSDAACASGHCIPSGKNGNCSGCTGTGTDDGHGCMPPPSSVACASTGGGTVCTTTLTPTPVYSASKAACLCVADSDCSSGKCVNANTQCTGTCTGAGTHDSEDCQTGTSVATAWSCSAGNCQNVSSPSGTCTAAGVPCWCTSDTQCPGETQCATWAGCAGGACTGSGTGNAFNCVP